jgi:hypothetical protein
MARQNRVTPFGDIVALEGRGLLMGNRGILHDGAQHITRYSQGRRWIACRTEFRGRRRRLMQPGVYTELFFLDDAAALAAGHRPCAECRRDDYLRFRTAWAEGGRGSVPDADAIDRTLHRDRLSAPGVKRTYRAAVSTLPDGTYIALDQAGWLVWGADLLAWSPGGYTERRPRPRHGDVVVITPRVVVDTITTGYLPAVHPSAATSHDREPTG